MSRLRQPDIGHHGNHSNDQQDDGKWIDKYSVFPDDKPNHGYDVMLGATALTEEQQKKIFRSGEHLVEITGSMQADVILRTYLKYNHLN